MLFYTQKRECYSLLGGKPAEGSQIWQFVVVMRLVLSQHHRTAEVGRELQRSPSPSLLLRKDHLEHFLLSYQKNHGCVWPENRARTENSQGTNTAQARFAALQVRFAALQSPVGAVRLAGSVLLPGCRSAWHGQHSQPRCQHQL